MSREEERARSVLELGRTREENQLGEWREDCEYVFSFFPEQRRLEKKYVEDC